MNVPMFVPQVHGDSAPHNRVRPLRQPSSKYFRRSPRSAQVRALGWEMAGRLTVNMCVSLVAVATLFRLVPYYQNQRQLLNEVEASVDTAEQQTHRLRADFNRHFDSTQTQQMIQENSAYHSEQHVPIVLVDPLAPSTTAGAGE